MATEPLSLATDSRAGGRGSVARSADLRTTMAIRGRAASYRHGMPKAVRVLLATLLLALVAGCSSDPPPAPKPSAPSAAERLASAKAKVDAASSVHMVLSSKNMPEDVSGVVSADGWGKHPPAFKGNFQVKVRGATAGTEVVAVDGAVYAKLPFVSVFTKVDPATLGAPDPATLFDPAVGITSLLTKTQNPTVGAQQRKGAEVLLTISGTLEGKAVTDLLKTGGAGSYQAVYGIVDQGDKSGELRTVELTGPFFGATASTYSLTLDRYGEPVDITKP